MKYRGRRIEGPPVEIIPILRQDGNIYIKVQGVVDLQPFFDLCPAPIPPKLRLPNNTFSDDIEDVGYKDSFNRWMNKRSDWTVINSLRPSFVPDGELEWERVDYKNPETWCEWQKEMGEAGFVDAEVQRIITAIMRLNGLNDHLIEKARLDFLASQVPQPNGQGSQKVEAPNTSSGAPA